MNRILIVSLFLLFVYSANAQSDSASPPKKYDIKSGKIIYKFKTGPLSGEKIFIFDNWGSVTKQIIATHMDTAGIKKMMGISDLPIIRP
jgi:hypothetical protein